MADNTRSVNSGAEYVVEVQDGFLRVTASQDGVRVVRTHRQSYGNTIDVATLVTRATNDLRSALAALGA